MHWSENPIYAFPEMKLQGLVFMYLAATKQAEQSWENLNSSQIHECGNWEREHYNSVLETMEVRTVSFLGLHKSEPVGFSTDLHLQYGEEGEEFAGME